MDGSDAREFVTGLGKPFAIIVDKAINKIVWTDSSRNMVQQAYLNGTLDKVNAAYVGNVMLRGLANAADKFKCFGARNSFLLRKIPFEKRDDYTIYNSSETINHLMTPSFKYDYGRENHCAQRVPPCDRHELCVLTPTASRCLSGQQ